MVRFADAMKEQLGTDKVFLSGDFNAYTREDPLQKLYDAGYTDIGSDSSPEEHTYLFDGTVGSLDHVLGNAAAMRTVTGAHVWNISSVESVALEYSRHNYNATDFYEPGPTAPPTTTRSSSASTCRSVRSRPRPPRRSRPVRWLRRPACREGAGLARPSARSTAGTVEVREAGILLGRGTVRDGAVEVTLPRYVIPGRHTLKVRYLGTAETRASGIRAHPTRDASRWSPRLACGGATGRGAAGGAVPREPAVRAPDVDRPPARRSPAGRSRPPCSTRRRPAGNFLVDYRLPQSVDPDADAATRPASTSRPTSRPRRRSPAGAGRARQAGRQPARRSRSPATCSRSWRSSATSCCCWWGCSCTAGGATVAVRGRSPSTVTTPSSSRCAGR